MGLTVVYVCIMCASLILDQTLSDTNICELIPTLHMDAAIKIWNFLKVNDGLKKSDAVIGLGSYDPRVAMETSRLWFAGWADIIVFSGKSGNLTKDKWKRPEADIFRDIAISLGVPKSKIYVENNSRNTGENMKFSHKLLKSLNRIPKTIILVQKPYMGKRTLATFWKQWPDAKNMLNSAVTVRTLEVVLERYPSDEVGNLSDVITIMMGDLQRLSVYYTQGYQTYQSVPEDVWEAYHILKRTNKYNKHLI